MITAALTVETQVDKRPLVENNLGADSYWLPKEGYLGR